MKIIDLLNNIVNGKPVPTRIRYSLNEKGYDTFTYNEEYMEYICDNDSNYCLSVPNHHLNDEIEIIEE